MSSRRYRPRRRLRTEILPLAILTALVATVLAIFPYDAVGLVARSGRPVENAPFAFVSLSPEAEMSALAAARAAWEVDAGGVRRMRADLLRLNFKEELPKRIFTAEERISVPRVVDETFVPSSLPASQAAPAARTIPAASSPAPSPTFPRSEFIHLP